jgi:hypothetical protein
VRWAMTEMKGTLSLKAPMSVRAAEEFSRVRLSQSFFMRDFLFSEIAAIERPPFAVRRRCFHMVRKLIGRLMYFAVVPYDFSLSDSSGLEQI